MKRLLVGILALLCLAGPLVGATPQRATNDTVGFSIDQARRADQQLNADIGGRAAPAGIRRAFGRYAVTMSGIAADLGFLAWDPADRAFGTALVSDVGAIVSAANGVAGGTRTPHEFAVTVRARRAYLQAMRAGGIPGRAPGASTATHWPFPLSEWWFWAIAIVAVGGLGTLAVTRLTWVEVRRRFRRPRTG